MGKRAVLVVVVAVALLAATGCDVFWTSVRFGPGNTANNDADTSITAAKVASMQTRFTAALGVVAPIPTPAVLPVAPVTSGGKVFVAAQGHVLGFSAAGTDGCSGSPATCTPIWSGDYGHPTWWSTFGPSVANGVVYVLAGNSDDQGGLFAFDATGARGCSGSPVVCQPLWTAPIVNDDAPTIAGGRVYASNAGGRLEVYDAAGVEGCSGVPVVCQPLWTAPSGEGVVPPSKPAVVDGVAYVATRSGTLVASDAAGVTNCSGAPKVCQPLWTAPGNGSFAGVPPAPVVGGGKAYVVHGQPGGAGGAEVAAYDAAGVTSCTGVPTTCAPLWRTPVQASIGSFYELALTDEYLLVPNAIGANLPPGPGNPALGQAFRVDGAGCATASCPPAFRWGGPVTPIVVNHLILFGAPQLFAVDAHGIANCSAGICAPVAQSAGPVGGTTATGRATAGGRVFTVSLAADGTGALTAAW